MLMRHGRIYLSAVSPAGDPRVSGNNVFGNEKGITGTG